MDDFLSKVDNLMESLESYFYYLSSSRNLTREETLFIESIRVNMAQVSTSINKNFKEDLKRWATS